MKECKWSKGEVCKLFKTVEKYKNENKPLLSAFEEFARKFARKTNSVRNFYYSQLRIFEKDKNLLNEYDIDITKHEKQKQHFFSAEEFEESMGKIDELTQKGFSVRRACQEVADGDIKKMLRLQNKYQAQKHKTITETSNVFVMPTKKMLLSDMEINSLFLGLVRLVKKNVEDNLESSYSMQIRNANYELRKSIKNLSEKEREVNMLRKKFELLSSEKNKLKEEIRCLRSQNVELLKPTTDETKLENLKTYIEKIKKESAIKT